MLNRIRKIVSSPRNIMSVVTVIVLVLIIYLSRKELVRAWELLGQADLWLLALLIPFQIIVYYAGGEMIFSYLRRQKVASHVPWYEQARIALELNVVNHVLPSGGISGASYATWRLHKLGVSAARSTFAQVVRYAAGFLAQIILTVMAVLILAIDGSVNRYIVASCFALVLFIVMLIFALVTMFSSEARMDSAARRIARFVNKFIMVVSFGLKKQAVKTSVVQGFFAEMHENFQGLMRDKRAITAPLIWGAIYTVFDIAMFMIAFWSLGESVNPAILLVGYVVAGLASLVAFTPGGAGVYEIVMIFFLTMAGVSPEVAIAGIVLTRTILLAGTLIFGYIFYQHALIKYGKQSDSTV